MNHQASYIFYLLNENAKLNYLLSQQIYKTKALEDSTYFLIQKMNQQINNTLEIAKYLQQEKKRKINDNEESDNKRQRTV